MLLIAGISATAKNCTFTGNGDGTSWTDADNWSCGQEPDPSGDNVTIPFGFSVVNDGGDDFTFSGNKDLTIHGSLDMEGKKLEMAANNSLLTISSTGVLSDVKELFFTSNSEGTIASGASVTVEHLKVDDNSELTINASCVSVTDKLENLSDAGIVGSGCITYSGSNGNFVNTGTDGIFNCFSNNLNDCTLSGGGGLPISLMHFRARLLEDHLIQLEWATASEINNDYFIIERSRDGLNYVQVAEMPGAGNSSSELEYSFVDERLDVGTYYYRLTQVDFDGQSESFDVIAVSVFDSDVNGCELSVNPNPCVPNCRVELVDCEDPTIETYVMDANGTIVQQLISLGDVSQGYSYSINTDNFLMPGIYIVRSLGKNTDATKKIIVK